MSLKDILSGENVVANINENMDKILSYIPEISFLIGFDQKDPDHNLDLWNHTLLALYYSDDEFDVRLALLLHDIGKPFAYIEGPIRHYYNVSGASTKMAYVILKRFGYEEAFINKILYLIKNCNGIIDDEVIERNPVLAEKLYEVQYCDIMAQDTKYLKDRVDYLTTTNYKLKKRRSRLYKKR
mgnify:CR=1 FL=1